MKGEVPSMDSTRGKPINMRDSSNVLNQRIGTDLSVEVKYSICAPREE